MFRILRILLSIVAVLVIAVGALIFFLPGEQIARLASDQVKEQFGRDLTIEGDVQLSFFPTLGISTGPVTLSNASWSSNGPMFQAEGAKIGVDAMALIGGTTHIKNITLTAPDILLEQDGTGQANWDDFTGAPTADATAATEEVNEVGGTFTLDQIQITNARIRYLDPKGTNLEIPDLTADFGWGEGAATLAATVVMGGAPIETSIEIGDLNDLIAGDVTQVKLDADIGQNKLSFEGLASTTPEADGQLSAELPNPSELFAALGQADAGLPSTDFKGQVTLTKDSVFSLREGRITLDGNDLSAEADVNLNGKPNVVASISAGALDLKRYLGGETSGGDAASASTGWPTDPIDASALGLFDGKITLSASSIDLGSLNFGSSRVAIDVDNSRAVATLHQLTGYEGTVTGQFVANNRSGFSVGGDMTMSDLALQGLLFDLIGSDRFTGAANARMAFLGSGGSVDAIMNSLRGDGSLSVGNGTISGLDLDQLFRGRPNSGTTIFDSMSASWTIDAGVLTNSDLLMDLPNVQAKGAGTVGLGAQNLDYTFTPQLKNSSDTGFSFPVRVTGPWASPSIRPDLEAVAKQNFQEEIDKLEDKAAEAVADRLGTTADQVENLGQNLEQELQKKLEEEVGNRLKNLLGGN
ncbi:MAG: AsmA family protein [Cognatishimia sp.]|nr:AsmA family protein [Cognatishimia sp.]